MAIRIQLRRDTAANWVSSNPVLRAGEVGIETDTLKFKIGNGSSTWAQITNYANVTPSSLGNTLGDYILLSTLGQPGGPAQLNSGGDVVVPDDSIILWNDGTFNTKITAVQPTADRVITIPNVTTTIVGTDTTQTLTNKTLTSPNISSIINTGTLTLPTTTGTVALTSNLTSFITASSADTLTNKTLTSPIVSGLTISDGSIVIEGATNDDHETTLQFTDPTADRTITFQNATGTVAFLSDISASTQGSVTETATQTLTNKTIALGSNTVTGTLANFNTALTDADFVSLAGAETLTNKTLTSPTLTGTPIAPTAAAATNTTQIATTEFVKTAIDNVISSAPGTLDTLNELAAALGNDANFSTTITNSIALKAPIASPTFTGTVSGVTAAMVGLGNVNNTSDADKPVSTATQTALNLKANLASPTFTGTVSGITKTMVGLENVDNTSDISKPISTATQTALDLKLNITDPAIDYYVTNSGSGAYLVNGVSNGTIYFERGKKYRIHVSASGHPFWIQTVSGGYSSGNVYSTGITNNGTQSGHIIVELPQDAPQLYYACQYHSSMSGSISVGAYLHGNIFDAKGDILTASADNTPVKLSVGTNGYILTANSAAANGIEWAAAPISLPPQSGNSGYYLTTDGTNASWGALVVPITTGTTTISSNTATTIDTNALAEFTSAEYMVSLKQGSKTRTSKVILQTDGTSVDMTEFAITETGGQMSGVVVSTTTSAGNALLQVTVTDAATTNVSVKISEVKL